GGDREAARLAAFPGGAEAVLGELPGAVGLYARLADRLARHLALGREDHLELDVRKGRRRERLAVEERRLNVLRRELGGGERGAGARQHRGREQTQYPCAHDGLRQAIGRRSYEIRRRVEGGFGPADGFPTYCGHGPRQNSTR